MTLRTTQRRGRLLPDGSGGWHLRALMVFGTRKRWVEAFGSDHAEALANLEQAIANQAEEWGVPYETGGLEEPPQ